MKEQREQILKQKRSLPSKHNDHTINSLIECLLSINIEFSALNHPIKMLQRKKEIAVITSPPHGSWMSAVVKHVNSGARIPGLVSLLHRPIAV